MLAMSDRIGELAQSLARLALESGATGEGPRAEKEPVSGETVDRLIRIRQSRADYMPTALIGEPAWDITLFLLQAELAGKRVPVSSVGQLSGLPERVASRWLEAMVQHGLVRRPRARAGSEELVELDPEVSTALRSYLRATFEDE